MVLMLGLLEVQNSRGFAMREVWRQEYFQASKNWLKLPTMKPSSMSKKINQWLIFQNLFLNFNLQRERKRYGLKNQKLIQNLHNIREKRLPKNN